jgi:hypothetical protein
MYNKILLFSGIIYNKLLLLFFKLLKLINLVTNCNSYVLNIFLMDKNLFSKELEIIFRINNILSYGKILNYFDFFLLFYYHFHHFLYFYGKLRFFTEKYFIIISIIFTNNPKIDFFHFYVFYYHSTNKSENPIFFS